MTRDKRRDLRQILTGVLFVIIVVIIIFLGSGGGLPCGKQCKLDNQAKKIELWQALVADCIERDIGLDNCEQMAFETVFTDKPGDDTTIIMPAMGNR